MQPAALRTGAAGGSPVPPHHPGAVRHRADGSGGADRAVTATAVTGRRTASSAGARRSGAGDDACPGGEDAAIKDPVAGGRRHDRAGERVLVRGVLAPWAGVVTRPG